MLPHGRSWARCPWYGQRHLPVFLAILAILLTLPSLGVGWIADDHFHRGVLLGMEPFPGFFGSPMDIFRFMDGNPERMQGLMDMGIAPWWSFKEAKGAFWRPVTAMTHRLDYRLWPKTPALMHAQSLLWFGALAASATVLYRRFLGITLLSGLAALLYAIDDAHGMPVGFLANRNAILATLFGILALIAHDRWRRDGWNPGIVIGPLLLAAGLLSAEAGIAACAYLFSYALFIDRATWRRRGVSLLPYIGVVIIWRILWTRMGYGVAGLGGYVDPVGEPLRFARAVWDRTPVLLLAQWALPPSEIALALGAKGTLILWAAASTFLALLIALLMPILRRDRAARFWALGMVLSVPPICAAFPSDRMLFFVGIGAMGLLAQFLADGLGKTEGKQHSLVRRRIVRPFAYFFVLIHFVLAPILLPFRAAYPMGPTNLLARCLVRAPMDSALERQDLIIVNHPIPLLDAYLFAEREIKGLPLPRRVRILCSGWSPVSVRRTDASTLVIRPKRGYMPSIADQLFRNEEHPLSLGERVELTGMTVEVTELTADKRPAEATFRFTVPLEDPSLRWLQWKRGGFLPFTPPEVGQTVEIQP